MKVLPFMRGGMDATEYKRERQRLLDMYGNPNDKSGVVMAKRDQAFATLFYSSGWTQERLAEVENKSQNWVSKRLRFGRFIAYATNKPDGLFVAMTEGRFRAYWDCTHSIGDEKARFAAVLHSMQDGKSQPARKTKKIVPKPQLAKARELVRPFVEANLSVSRDDIVIAAEVSHYTVDVAVQCEEVRLETLREIQTAPIDTSILDKSAQDRLAALESRLRAKHEAEFNERLRRGIEKHIDEVLMPRWGERLAKADRLMQGGKPFSHAEFRILLRALHPDSANYDTDGKLRDVAFGLLMEKEYLLRSEEKAHPLSSGLPTSLAELQARRKN